MLLWTGVAQSLYVQSPFLVDRVIDTDAQMEFVKTHPLQYVKASYHTHATVAGDGHIRGAVGIFGWLDAPIRGGRFWYTWAACLWPSVLLVRRCAGCLHVIAGYSWGFLWL
jgi:hypothetical protein